MVTDFNLKLGGLYAVKVSNVCYEHKLTGNWKLVEFLRMLPDGRYLIQHAGEEYQAVELHYVSCMENE